MKSTDAGMEIEAAAATSTGSASTASSPDRADPAATPPAPPSYYVARFRAQFPAADGVVPAPLSLPQRYAVSMARRPRTHLLVAFGVALVLSFVGFRFGEFAVSIDNSGERGHGHPGDDGPGSPRAASRRHRSSLARPAPATPPFY